MAPTTRIKALSPKEEAAEMKVHMEKLQAEMEGVKIIRTEMEELKGHDEATQPLPGEIGHSPR
jgi:antitoxin component HigA of HigAB toxin-antitoxin module